MRLVHIALPFLLAACAPSPGPASPAPAAAPAAAPAPAPSVANADTRALQQPPVAGAWSARTDEGVFAAHFGERLILICSAPNGVITLTLAGTPASVSTLRLLTATRTLDLASHGGSVRLDADAPAHDLFISTLGTPGDRFAIDAGGALTVFPWDDALRTTLSACRADEPPSQLPTPGPR